MTEAKQTKCPHCGSTFRISEAQLSAKGGNVRCGSCLQVFRADLYLVGAQAVASPRPVSAKPSKPKAKPDDESWALELLGEEPAATATPDKAIQSEDHQRPQRASRPAEPDWQAGTNYGDEVDTPDFVAASPNGSRERSLRFDDELSDMLDDVGDGLTHEDAEPINASADESWAQGILSELEQEEHKQKKYGMEVIRDDQPPKAPIKNAKLAAAMGQRVDEEALAAARASSHRPSAQAKPAPAALIDEDDEDALGFLNQEPDLDLPKDFAAGNPFALDRPLAHVDAPLVLKPQREPIAWGRLLTWSFLCLVALAMFAAQYIYFNFDKLAADTRYRPYLEQGCAQLGCVVPEVPDINKLKIDSLVVRTHPKVEGALAVDAIIRNSASFAQPFPALHLRFTDKDDALIASRDLQASEYLQGDMARLRRIPPGTPVRISVELANPGSEAVNYSMEPRY